MKGVLCYRLLTIMYNSKKRAPSRRKIVSRSILLDVLCSRRELPIEISAAGTDADVSLVYPGCPWLTQRRRAVAGVDSGSRSEGSQRNLELSIELQPSLNPLISATTLRRATSCESRHYSWPYSIHLHLQQHHTILRHVSTRRPPPSPDHQGTTPLRAAGSCEIWPCATIDALFYLPTQHYTSFILGIHDPKASPPSWPS